jgi:hypothetical protein
MTGAIETTDDPEMIALCVMWLVHDIQRMPTKTNVDEYSRGHCDVCSVSCALCVEHHCSESHALRNSVAIVATWFDIFLMGVWHPQSVASGDVQIAGRTTGDSGTRRGTCGGNVWPTLEDCNINQVQIVPRVGELRGARGCACRKWARYIFPALCARQRKCVMWY